MVAKRLLGRGLAPAVAWATLAGSTCACGSEPPAAPSESADAAAPTTLTTAMTDAGDDVAVADAAIGIEDEGGALEASNARADAAAVLVVPEAGKAPSPPSPGGPAPATAGTAPPATTPPTGESAPPASAQSAIDAGTSSPPKAPAGSDSSSSDTPPARGNSMAKGNAPNAACPSGDGSASDDDTSKDSDNRSNGHGHDKESGQRPDHSS
jgi:hypothetical protein